MELDTTKLRQSGFRKTVSHDNCVVLAIGTGSFPRYIEVRPPGDDGSRMTAIWDGSLDLAVNNKVIAIEYGGNPVWRVSAIGGGDDGAGSVRVDKVWESDFGAVALQADADGNIGIGTASLSSPLHVFETISVSQGIVPSISMQTSRYGSEIGGGISLDFQVSGGTVVSKIGSDIISAGDFSFGIWNWDGSALQRRITIRENGDVGIGTTSTSVSFAKVESASTGNKGISSSAYSTTSTFAGEPTLIMLKSHNASIGVLTETVDTERLGSMGIVGVDSNNAARSTAGFRVTQVGAAAASNVPSKMDLIAANNAVIMTLDESRNVTIAVGYLGFTEMTAPGAGAANTARLFSRDDGGGDTELCVRFNSGLIQVIAPLEFGGISVEENAAQTTISTAGVAVQITVFDTDEAANGATPDHTNDHVTVNKAGSYWVVCSLTATSIAGASAKFHFEANKNNGATHLSGIHADRDMAGGGSDTGSVAMSGLAVLSSGDTIEVWVTNETNTQNVIIEDINLAISMVGVNA
jgi:hypothetical protein